MAKALGPSTEFAAVVRRHQAMVYSVAYHLPHDRGLAEEVAHDPAQLSELGEQFGIPRVETTTKKSAHKTTTPPAVKK